MSTYYQFNELIGVINYGQNNVLKILRHSGPDLYIILHCIQLLSVLQLEYIKMPLKYDGKICPSMGLYMIYHVVLQYHISKSAAFFICKCDLECIKLFSEQIVNIVLNIRRNIANIVCFAQIHKWK